MKKICVLADPTGDIHTALQRAIPLAEKTKSSINFVGIVYAYDLEQLDTASDVGEIQQRIIESRLNELRNTVKKYRSKNSDISTEVLWGKDACAVLLDYLNSDSARDTSFVIKSGHRSESLLHTATDQLLIRKCPVPVMIVREKTWKKRASILAAIDLGTKRPAKIKLNHKVMDHAAQLAKATDRELHCVYVIRVSPILKDLDLMDPTAYAKRVRKDISPKLKELQEKYGIAAAHCHVVAGDPARRVPSVANKIKADFVVMGTVGRGGVKAAFLGNTAESTLRRLHTDVLTLRP